MPLIKLTIKGMHCKSCKMLIEDILEDYNAKIISFDLDEDNQTGSLHVETETPAQAIMDAIQAEGDYQVRQS